ncbi:MAG: MFS transporter [Acidimicrobiales bacterium]
MADYVVDSLGQVTVDELGTDAGRLTTTENRALRSIAVLFWVNGAVLASYIPRLPGIRDRLDLDLSTIGTILAVATGAGLLGSIAVGPAVERFPTRNVMLAGSLTLTVLLPFVSLVPNAAALLLVLVVLSIADVFTDVAMNIQGSFLSTRRSVPIMQRLHAMWSLGTVVGGLVAAAMAALNVDLRVHLLGASIFLFLALLYVAPGLLPGDEATSDRGEAPASAGSSWPVVLTFAALGAAAIVPEMINSDWAAFRLTDDLGTSNGVAGMGYVAFTVGMVTGRLAGDSAVHRFGHRRVLRGATVLAGLGITVATLIPAVPAVFVGLLVAGTGVSVMFPELYDAAAQHSRPGKALGGLTAGSRIALLAAPLLVGVLADTDTFTVGAAIALATIPGALTVLWLSAKLPSRPR